MSDPEASKNFDPLPGAPPARGEGTHLSAGSFAHYSPNSFFAFPPQIAATVFASSDSVFTTCPTGS